MEDQNLLCCLHGVIIPFLHGIKNYIRTKIMEHHSNKVDVKFLRDFILFAEGSCIHNC